MSDRTFVFESSSEADTIRLGEALATVVPDGTVIALDGTLGAGKTRLVQAIAAACGVDRRDVVSPTFVLVQEYHGTRTLYHVDAYRLRGEDEFLGLGVDEYFGMPAIVLIEWAERVQNCLPNSRLSVRIEVTGNDTRRFEVAANGVVLQPVIDELATKF